MAHEIDESTGRPAIGYVGEGPWHGLGEKLPERQAIEVWLRAARLGWELKRLPVRYLVEGRLRTMDRSFFLAGSDTHEPLSIVSGDYHIVQPREVLEFYRDLMDEYVYTLGGWSQFCSPFICQSRNSSDAARGEEFTHFVVKLVANPPECREAFRFAPLDCGRIFQTPVNPFRTAGKHRTLITRVVADCDDVIEMLPSKLVN